jgi:hypothetical protein
MVIYLKDKIALVFLKIKSCHQKPKCYSSSVIVVTVYERILPRYANVSFMIGHERANSLLFQCISSFLFDDDIYIWIC